MHLVAADQSAIQSLTRAARRAGERSLFDLQRLGGERVAAMIAKLRAVVDAGQAAGANRVEVLLAEREIRAAEFTLERPIATGLRPHELRRTTV